MKKMVLIGLAFVMVLALGISGLHAQQSTTDSQAPGWYCPGMGQGKGGGGWNCPRMKQASSSSKEGWNCPRMGAGRGAGPRMMGNSQTQPAVQN